MNTLDPAGHVAILPQPSYWSWKFYDFGYRGSGFLWYGLTQPIMDRAFDPWSRENENYYWELSAALYAEDAERLESVFRKYDVKYILVDENVVSPNNNRSLFVDESKELLASIPTIRQSASFGKLTLYERTNTEYESFVKLTGVLPSVNPYSWTDNDVAYREVGDYLHNENNENDKSDENNVITYPFRSLFTKRSVDERDFTINEDEQTITILPLPFRGLPIQNISKHEVQQRNKNEKQCIRDAYFHVDIDPVFHTFSKSNTTAKPNDTIPNTTLKVKAMMPCDVSKENINGNTTTEPIQAADKLVRNPDNTRYTEGNALAFIDTTLPEATAAVNIIHKANALVYDSIKTTDLNPRAVKECGLLKTGKSIASTANENSMQFLRFDSINQRGCLSFNIPDLPHREGYLVAVERRHIEGRPLMFSLINQTAKHVELETYLNTRHPSRVIRQPEWQTDWFILPPLAPDGLGYNPYISNDSIGRHRSTNDLRRIRIYKIPYDELVHLRTGEIASSSATSYDDMKISHPNPAYYKILIDGSRVEPGMTIILSQSFDPGWLAYTINAKCQMINAKCTFMDKIKARVSEIFPFLFGSQLTDHVLVNNWSNGWSLPSTMNNEPGTIIIFFWPQLLEFLGFAMLPLPFFILWRKK